MKVPRFKEYFATPEKMNKKQREFYDYWCLMWEKGKSIPVDGQISYIFCYIYDLLYLPFEVEEETAIKRDLMM